MALKGIMKKIEAFKRKAVQHTVNECEFNFYPVRIGRLLSGEIRDAVAPIARAVTVLMTCGDSVRPEKHTQVGGPDDPNGVYSKEGEISVQTQDWLNATRGNAVHKALTEIIDPKTNLVIGRVLADSLRDDFNRDTPDEEIQEFMDELDVRDLAEFIVGFLKANAEVFGFDASNREKVGNVVRDLLAKVKESAASGSLAPLQAVPEEETEETEESQQTPTTTP